jgi:hypothetical protein
VKSLAPMRPIRPRRTQWRMGRQTNECDRDISEVVFPSSSILVVLFLLRRDGRDYRTRHQDGNAPRSAWEIYVNALGVLSAPQIVTILN